MNRSRRDLSIRTIIDVRWPLTILHPASKRSRTSLVFQAPANTSSFSGAGSLLSCQRPQCEPKRATSARFSSLRGTNTRESRVKFSDPSLSLSSEVSRSITAYHQLRMDPPAGCRSAASSTRLRSWSGWRWSSRDHNLMETIDSYVTRLMNQTQCYIKNWDGDAK